MLEKAFFFWCAAVAAVLMLVGSAALGSIHLLLCGLVLTLVAVIGVVISRGAQG